ncbi:response regulator receiver domain [Aeromonas salmonicida]|uniref:response regulator receiver domain n=1 Tax=Aeromonas salmonicida TaxID=645 RepID=UPI00125FBB39|nr:response regulator receiver domain [Aeromonas salmonicida]
MVSPSVSEQRDNISDIVQSHEYFDAHTLDIRKVSDAFAESGIACSFVLPCDEDHDEELKINRILSSAKLTDIVVIDWYLHRDNPNLTRQVLTKLAESDASAGGRLRLIAVYTGQLITDGLFSDIKDSLSEGGVSVRDIDGQRFTAKNDSCLVIALNKAEVSPTDLPERLFELFLLLSEGLIPSFSLAAVGAIRKNMHHLVTRFSKELDTAYISNRLITNPPTDVTELMRDLLVSEFDNAIGLERIADEYLNVESIKLWLDAHQDNFSLQEYKRGKIDKDFIVQLLNSGIDDKGFKSGTGAAINFPVEKRGLISVALAGDIERSKTAQNKFSRLVAFKREAVMLPKFSSHVDWSPSLTTGTLLRHDSGRFFLCLTPACDTLRLVNDSSFVFLEAMLVEDGYSVILMGKSSDDIKLKFDRKRPKLSTFVFTPDVTQRVRGLMSIDGQENFIFQDAAGNDLFTWLGEIRYGRAASEMAQLVGNWMRIGINDSEHLRLIDAGRISG